MNATVLFADVSGAAALYRAAGHTAALKAISQCIEQVRNAAQSTDGRIVKLIGDEVMVLFATPDAAAKAAAKMHQSVEALPPVEGTKLGLRVGFHSGPVFRSDRDVLGDTVKLAAKLLEQAQKGQTITTGQTAAQLSPGMRPFSRDLQRVALTGKAETIRLCEILKTSVNGAARAQDGKARTMVRLTYDDQVVICSREKPRIVIGRQNTCDVVIGDKMASREHCTLEVRGDEFVLLDHSTNGTYVTVEGEHEILLNGEALALATHGWIAFGHPHGGSAEAAEFFGR
jgi:class 3 adenylate cyclase